LFSFVVPSRRRHRHFHARGVEGGLELPDDPVALGGRRVPGDEVVVVEVHAVGAQLRELLDDARRRYRRADGIAERIAARVADRPQSEREVVLGPRRVGVIVVVHESVRTWLSGTLSAALPAYVGGKRATAPGR
jgi:hypothetical protein